jgi:fructose-bisphosphate aldolase class II
MMQSEINALIALLDESIEADERSVSVKNPDKLKTHIHKLSEITALESGKKSAVARYLIRGAALDLGIIPASIHDLYLARGRGEVPLNFTVPAINLRVLPYHAARMVFRVAKQMDAGALIFEIARSEIGYTDQRPSEYAAHVLAAAITESFRGPVFIQGDHFQVSSTRYAEDAEKELQTIRDLTQEAIHAGFFNIDIDTSTLVNLNKETVVEQQELNFNLSADFTAFIRAHEPNAVTISVGGEIGEVGGQNSTEDELRIYVEGFNAKLGEISPNTPGLSKISIQSGTSHGGVVLPNGSIAQVKVDFDTILRLSRVAREEFGMAGAVQHGASTLPQDAFGKFVESEACEVHLATNFQNIFFDHAPDQLKKEIYAFLDKNHTNERKADMTDDQFYYKTRKNAIGPFKKQIWGLPSDVQEKASAAWEKQFQQLFTSLGIANTNKYIDKFITAPKHLPSLKTYIKVVTGKGTDEDSTDLAD